MADKRTPNITHSGALGAWGKASGMSMMAKPTTPGRREAMSHSPAPDPLLLAALYTIAQAPSTITYMTSQAMVTMTNSKVCSGILSPPSMEGSGRPIRLERSVLRP